MILLDGHLARVLCIGAGLLVAGVGFVWVMEGMAGGFQPVTLVVAPVLLAVGSWLTWIGITWYSDGENGVVGGGPYVSVRLVPGESIQRVKLAVFRELPREPNSLGDAFHNDVGRLYLSDRRLIYCPSRFRLGRGPVRVPLSEIAAINGKLPARMAFTEFGTTVTMKHGAVFAFWPDEVGFTEDLRSAAANAIKGAPVLLRSQSLGIDAHPGSSAPA
jgi:hypothetical protein